MRIFRYLIPILFAFVMLPPPVTRAAVDVSLTITVPPPALPVYAQPIIPGEGYIWAPGYWAWGPYGYYWVPGTWVLPPRVGLLWTPGYWAWDDGVYIWRPGYWGPHIGYYGGINYGFGYIGVGYFGGFWDHDRFHYNRAVNNFGGVHITNVYNKTVINNVNVTRVSFNGGQGGTRARPNAAEQTAARDQHAQPTELQTRHEQVASNNTAMRWSENHGKPSIAATPHPAAFTERGTVGARGGNAAGAASPNGPHAIAATPRGTAATPDHKGPPHQPSGQAGVQPPRGAAAAPDNGRPQHPSGQAGGQPPRGNAAAPDNGRPQHPSGQAGAQPPRGAGPHVATAPNAQRAVERPQGRPGPASPQGGPPTHQVSAAPHPAGAPQGQDAHGKPQAPQGEHQDNGQHPDDHQPDHH
jgi:hypothetical protein